MLKALFLDLGNVMLSYDPRAMVEPWTQSTADRDEIIRALFQHPDWGRSDDGAITQAQLRENTRLRLPSRLHAALDKVLDHWPEYLLPLPGAEAFVRDMKARGFKLYALSNAPLRYRQFRKNLKLLDLFDGEVISALVGFSKPGAEIFKYALSAFSLAPEACFFVDDLAPNVEGAARCGIDGCVFDGDYQKLSDLILSKNSV